MAYVPGVIDTNQDINTILWLEMKTGEWYGVPKDWAIFFDEASGANIHRAKFYGFSDAGGLAGSFEGYDTREACVAACKEEAFEDIGVHSDQLGDSAICVLSGEEYVNRLSSIDNVFAYGRFVQQNG